MKERSLEGQYAGCVTRLFAWLVDRGIILAVITAGIWLITIIAGVFDIDVTQCSIGAGFTIANTVCWATILIAIVFSIGFAPFYLIVFWALAGQTLGMALIGLRIVSMDGKNMTLRKSIRRYIGYLMSFLAFGFGFMWILFDNRRQGFHDKFADTCVVYVWDARQNERLIDRLTDRLFLERQQLEEYGRKVGGKMTETENRLKSSHESPDTSISPHLAQADYEPASNETEQPVAAGGNGVGNATETVEDEVSVTG